MLLWLADRNVTLSDRPGFGPTVTRPSFSVHPGEARCLNISWSPNIFPIIVFSSHPPPPCPLNPNLSIRRSLPSLGALSVSTVGWSSLTYVMRCRHILSEQIRLGPAATGDLTLLIHAVEFTSKFIASNVRKARLINLFDPPFCSLPRHRID